ncbi:metallophosphoesterase [Plesiomonas shigelloides subsp. oncorhynchi]|nr:metallophosphoesterase [Plesiomonas shigelloides]
MIWLAGDPHGSLDYLLPLLHSGRPDALIILGDLALHSSAQLQALEELTQVWFIPGNHDSLSVAAYEALFSGPFRGRNLHGRVTEVAGVRVAGLGGVFRGQIWMPPYKPMFFDPIHYCQHLEQSQLWHGGLPLRHRTTLFPSDLEGLSQQQADILVTRTRRRSPMPVALRCSMMWPVRSGCAACSMAITMSIVTMVIVVVFRRLALVIARCAICRATGFVRVRKWLRIIKVAVATIPLITKAMAAHASVKRQHFPRSAVRLSVLG